MSKIAVISDVHANVFALSEFIDRVEGEVEKIYCCGDILGYYPYYDETLALFEKYKIVSIQGNHDKYITGLLAPQRPNEMLASSIFYGKKQLSEKTKKTICGLPDILKFKTAGVELSIFHGLFDDCEACLCEDNLGVFFQNRENLPQVSDFNFFGHTHVPFIKEINGKTFINVGSLGYPRDGAPAYVIVDLENKLARKFNFQYLTEKLKRDIEARKYDAAYTRMLLGRL